MRGPALAELPPELDFDLGGGVRALVFTALFADATGTLPRGAAGPAEPEARSWPADHRATRIGDVVIAWNVFEHFYPYFDVVKTDWPAELGRALTSAATDADERAFQRTLERLVAALHDGHGSVSGFESGARVPVLWDWVEGRLTIVNPGDQAGVARGDVVLSIHHVPVEQLVEETTPLVSGATPQWIRWRLLQALPTGEAGQPIELEIKPYAAPGTRRSVSLPRGMPPDPYATEPRPAKIAEVRSGILYVDLGRVNDQDWTAALPRLEAARGIIFDLRGYPILGPSFLQHLIDKPFTSARFEVPVITEPDRRNIQWDEGNWNLAPLAPYLKARRVFLTDGRAISYAESVMGIVEHYRMAEIVGGATAGTNGNINPFTLPGGYRIVWTGMRVRKHDGSTHHGVGIAPTVPAARTRAGVAQGRDEVLEQGIAVLEQAPDTAQPR